ncbi:MAG: helix-turn-helix transcriptional regulator [Oscillospiraceae bacterium]|nr:helix-turn-helix transcriptional regulator [Oscillospiraceae bacterium]MBQ2602520.1 helix-turn-helix transcriptional regulator [Oscillospiraceae bacterium]
MPTIDIKATGQNIARLRNDTGITVKKMQDILGFGTPQAIYKWQRGDTLPTIDNMVVLADIFKVRIDDIVVLSQKANRP